ncbi:S8 family peptidase [Lysinibacillus sp. FSL H8-0500]|uniref:S8 family peptidase n=1 Tax=Lysinibacillus sp. FSL H8-0500 TaxID=2921393 RepID=UPI0031014C09
MVNVLLPKFTIKQLETRNYGIEKMGVGNLWKKNTKGKRINVAVIDTGCDVEHEELKEAIIGTYNFTTDDNGEIHNVTDYIGHGTHVSGIIGARNNIYDIGIAPETNLLILKVINKSGSGNINDLYNAVEYAINWRGNESEKIDVINMSLGTTEDSVKLKNAIIKAVKKNVIIVAAAGNEGDGKSDTLEISYPGYYSEVFQIGATDINDNPTFFTNSNKNVDFLAPGKDIFSSKPNNKYAILSGTSMAAAQVAGVIALIKGLYRQQGLEVSNITISDYLKQRSTFLPKISTYIQGFGLIKI